MSNSILEFFPHPEFRADQKETLLDIQDLLENEFDNICIEMPTGGGKSAIAFTVARWIKENSFNNGKAYIVTPQKILQDQYYSDIERLNLSEEMKLLKGKGNYDCLKFRDNFKKCDSCIVSLGKKCEFQEACLYYKAEKEAIKAQTTILNYHILHILDDKLYNRCFDEKTGGIDKDKYSYIYKRDLLIIDEAHNTESFLMDLITVSVKVPEHAKNMLNETFDAEKTSLFLDADMEEIRARIIELSKVDEDSEEKELAENAKKISTLQRRLLKLEYLQLTFKNGNWAFIKDIREDDFKKKYLHAITAKPIFVNNYASLFFRCGLKKIFLSATLPNKEVFCKSLNLDESKTEFIKLNNTFPIENRKIYYINSNIAKPITNTNIFQMGESAIIDPLIASIKLIINYEPLKNHKGLIITHSNKFMQTVLKELRGYRHFIPCMSQDENDFDARLKAIEDHKNCNTSSILIGPCLYEGLDLKYDLCRFVIMFKCPYPFEDEQIKARREVDRAWYNNGIAIKIIQGLGRGMRANDDWVLNFLIDPGFDNFINRQGRSYIPNYIYQALEQMPKCFLN